MEAKRMVKRAGDRGRVQEQRRGGASRRPDGLALWTPGRLVMGTCAAWLAIVSLVLCLPAAVQGDDASYEKFCNEFKAIASDNLGARRLGELIKSNRNEAKRLIHFFREKAKLPGPDGKACQRVCIQLADIMLLTDPGKPCAPATIRRLKAATDRQATEEDKVYFLETLAESCPLDSPTRIELGDLYVGQGQYGMACNVFQEVLNHSLSRNSANGRRLDAGTRSRVEEKWKHAKALLDRYESRKRLAASDVRQMFYKSVLMRPEQRVFPKARISRKIQHRVLFEEWSADIQEQYKEELDVLGREISAYFREEPRACLRISGHTDKRGPLERNLAISKKRAKSVKDYLVNHFAIEPERILAEGCGPWKPMSPRDDPVGWQLNRRVEFTRVQ